MFIFKCEAAQMMPFKLIINLIPYRDEQQTRYPFHDLMSSICMSLSDYFFGNKHEGVNNITQSH